jgi:putative nucleotidyltransferase with HDIG domain
MSEKVQTLALRACPRRDGLWPRPGDTLSQTLYLSVVIAAGLFVIVASLGQVVDEPVAVPCIILAALTALSGAATLRMPNVPVSFSVSDSFTITAAALFGPAAGALTVAIDSLVISFRLAQRKNPLRRLVFNATAPALAMWTAAYAFSWLVGAESRLVSGGPVGHLIGPLVIFAALFFVLNTGLIAGAVALEQRQTLLTIWRRHFLGLWLTYFGGAAVAMLLIVLVYALGSSPLVFGLVAPIPLILYVTFKTAIGRMEDQLGHLRQVNRMHSATIETLAHAIDAKDQVTHGHIRRVQHAALRLAASLGVSEAETSAIEAASLLHDLGKLAVPEHILNKPGRLTPSEFDTMKRHAAVGADMLSAIDFPFPVVPIVRHHHEHWDGTGYPAGLRGSAIPIGARILSVVDCFDALTSDRPYRRKLPVVDALRILRERSGTMYDPEVVDRFIEIHDTLALEADPEPGPDTAAALGAAGQHVATGPLLASPRSSRASARPDPIEGRGTPTQVEVPGSSEPHDRAVLAAFYDLGLAIGASRSVSSAVESVYDLVTRVMPVGSLAVFAHNSAEDRLIARWVAGPHRRALQSLTIPIGRRLTGWVAANRSTIVNSDAALDLGDAARDVSPPLRSCISTVLERNGELVGVVTIYTTSANPFADAHVTMIEAIASRLAPLVQRAIRDTTIAGASSAPAAQLKVSRPPMTPPHGP